MHEDEEESSSSDEDTHHLLNSSLTSLASSQKSSRAKFKEEAKKAILRTHAIQRVQHCIPSKGGTCTSGIKLVDNL